VVEIANRFPEINPSNYGSDEVDALNAWGIEVVQALASINSTAPVGEEKPENEVREKLRAAWMRVQAAKRKGGAGLQPLWDVVNLVPAVLYELDHMAAFEQDAQAEEFAALPAQDVGGLEAGDVEWLRAALPKVHPNLHGINPPEMIAANEAVNARIDRLIAALSIKPQERS
jgi:hypothetical protein